MGYLEREHFGKFLGMRKITDHHSIKKVGVVLAYQKSFSMGI